MTQGIRQEQETREVHSRELRRQERDEGRTRSENGWARDWKLIEPQIQRFTNSLDAIYMLNSSYYIILRAYIQLTVSQRLSSWHERSHLVDFSRVHRPLSS
jgi:hypothetical protein